MSENKFQKMMKSGGKGSNRRKENIKEVRKNWDEIKGFKPSKFK
jgi:hypothetical protein